MSHFLMINFKIHIIVIDQSLVEKSYLIYLIKSLKANDYDHFNFVLIFVIMVRNEKVKNDHKPCYS